MNIINFTLFKKTSNKTLYRIKDDNNKDIFLKLSNIRLPFNFQFYNNKLFLNAELFPSEGNYDDNLLLMNQFEDCIKNSVYESIRKKTYCSVIKEREKSKHLKFMLKRDSKDIILIADDDLDLKKMTEYHKSGIRYDIVVKPEVLWENDDTYGVIFYIYSIKTVE